MALTPLNFPNAPTVGQTYPSPPVTGQPTYIWDGADWLSYFALGKAYVPLDGSQPMTGLLTLSGDPTAPLHAVTKQYDDANALIVAQMMRSYLAGLTLSTAGASAVFGVAPGVAMNSTNVAMMSLTAAYTKTTAAWAVGSSTGGLDTGAIAPSTWYHVHLIRRPDTGVVDVLISLSATAPTLPASYTQFRRIGAMKTNASSQWTLFSQNGDEFIWPVTVTDVAGVTPTSPSRTLYALSVPTGTIVNALIRAFYVGTATSSILITSPDESDQAPGGTTVGLTVRTTAASDAGYATVNPRTNTSAQVGARSNTNAGTFTIVTYGWIDRRGRDA